MSKKELIELVKSSGYLTSQEKKKWLGLLPKFNQNQLKEFSSIMGWAEEQKINLDKEKALIEGSFYQLFTVMKRYGTKRAKKETLANAEAKEKLEEDKYITSLLKDDEKKS